MKKYCIRLDPDPRGGPPTVIIHEVDGPDVMEFYEVPRIVPGEWDRWAPGLFAQSVLQLLNGEEPEDNRTTTGALCRSCGPRSV